MQQRVHFAPEARVPAAPPVASVESLVDREIENAVAQVRANNASAPAASPFATAPPTRRPERYTVASASCPERYTIASASASASASKTKSVSLSAAESSEREHVKALQQIQAHAQAQAQARVNQYKRNHRSHME